MNFGCRLGTIYKRITTPGQRMIGVRAFELGDNRTLLVSYVDSVVYVRVSVSHKANEIVLKRVRFCRTFNDNINNKSKNKYVNEIMITMLQIYEHISLLSRSHKISLWKEHDLHGAASANWISAARCGTARWPGLGTEEAEVNERTLYR